MQHTNSAPPRSSTPSPRKRTRRDGWTTDRQVKFIIAFKTRSVTRAAAAAGMSRESAYRLRDRPGHADFARPWDAAVARKGHNRFAEVTTALGLSPRTFATIRIRSASSPSRACTYARAPTR